MFITLKDFFEYSVVPSFACYIQSKPKEIIVYQRFECNLLLLDISIRTLWIRPSTGATNVTGTAFHPQSPEFVADFSEVCGA
jgi:hypothetical protein